MYLTRYMYTLHTAIDCGKPGEVVNGHTNTSEGTTAGATVHYMCDRGYIINGPASRTCGYDGNWTGSVPTCESKFLS